MGCTARVARTRAEGAAHQTPLLLLLTTAMPASRIGWRVGAPRRRNGAARTQERVALRKTEVVPRVPGSFLNLGDCTPQSKPEVLASHAAPVVAAPAPVVAARVPVVENVAKEVTYTHLGAHPIAPTTVVQTESRLVL